MVRDILDLHGVGGQGVRESTKFPGEDSNGATHRVRWEVGGGQNSWDPKKGG